MADYFTSQQKSNLAAGRTVFDNGSPTGKASDFSSDVGQTKNFPTLTPSDTGTMAPGNTKDYADPNNVTGRLNQNTGQYNGGTIDSSGSTAAATDIDKLIKEETDLYKQHSTDLDKQRDTLLASINASANEQLNKTQDVNQQSKQTEEAAQVKTGRAGTPLGAKEMSASQLERQQALDNIISQRQDKLAQAQTAYENNNFKEAQQLLSDVKDLRVKQADMQSKEKIAATTAALKQTQLDINQQNADTKKITAETTVRDKNIAANAPALLEGGDAAIQKFATDNGYDLTAVQSGVLKYMNQEKKDDIMNAKATADILAKTTAGGTTDVPGVGKVEVVGADTFKALGGNVYQRVGGKLVNTGIASIDFTPANLTALLLGIATITNNPNYQPGGAQDAALQAVEKIMKKNGVEINIPTGGVAGLTMDIATSFDQGTTVGDGECTTLSQKFDPTLVGKLGYTNESKHKAVDELGVKRNVWTPAIGDTVIIDTYKTKTGHTATVNSVNDDGTVTLTEQNMTKDKNTGKGIVDNTRRIKINDPSIYGAIPTRTKTFDYTDPVIPKNKRVEDPTTGSSYNAAYQNALSYALKGGTLNQFIGGYAAGSRQDKKYKKSIDELSSAIIDASGVDKGELQKEYKTSGSVLTKITNLQSMVNQFDETALSNLDIAIKQFDAMPNTGKPWFERFKQAYSKATGDASVSGAQTAINTFTKEYAKLMSGNTSASGATISSQKDAEEMVSSYMSKGQFGKVIGVMKQDMSNRQKALDDEVAKLANNQTLPALAKFYGYLNSQNRLPVTDVPQNQAQNKNSDTTEFVKPDGTPYIHKAKLNKAAIAEFISKGYKLKH